MELPVLLHRDKCASFTLRKEHGSRTDSDFRESMANIGS